MSFENAVAQLEQTNAQLVNEVVRARDAIMGLNKMYPTITAGRDAVAVGEYFTVPGTGTLYATLYQKTGATTQTTVAEFPSRQAYTQLADAIEALGTAATANVATLQEALDGTAGVLPDAAGVRAAINDLISAAIEALGTAAAANVATLQEALDGTAGVLPDAAGVRAAINDLISAAIEALGTAADANVATLQEALDGTAGVLPDAAGVRATIEQFGFGADSVYLGESDYNIASQTPARIFKALNLAAPSPGQGERAVLNLVYSVGSNQYRGAQISCRSTLNQFSMRSVNEAGNENWVDLHHTGNMQPNLAQGLNSPRLMRNLSGGNIADGATVAGSSLRFCLISNVIAGTNSSVTGDGTWKSVNGVNLANNDYGLFVRIA